MSIGLPAPRRVDVRSIRERYGLSQADVAQGTHVDERTVRRWETGASSPSPMAMAHLRSMTRRLQAERDRGQSGDVPRSSAATENEATGQAPAEAGLLPRRRLPSL